MTVRQPDDRPVAIIGAGGAGLAAAQALGARNVPFTVFEAGSGLGGNWRYDNDSGHGSAYESLRTNVSRRNTSFRCFPIGRGSTFMHHTEMLAYLEDFADHFELRPHIRFSTPVKDARPVDGGWEITTDDGVERYRAVVVAVGYNSEPRFPEHSGHFDGLVQHTHDYRTPEPFTRKDVVVVGLGCSAGELACEVRKVARSVTIAARSGAWVTARRIGPLPMDWLDTRAGSRLPWSVRRRMFAPMVRLSGGRQIPAGIPTPPGRIGDKPLCVSDELIGAVRCKEIDIAPDVVELCGDRVRLADGTDRQAQALLLGTGYQVTFPFLAPEAQPPSLEDAPLYRGIASLATDGLFFVGLVYGLGPLIPMFEAQASWLGEHLAGRLDLPSPEVMALSVERDASFRMRSFDPRLGIFWDRIPYIRALEREARTAVRHPGVLRTAARATT
jgi:dimethylaniline monooxygenase (N-oxide forming)